MARNFAIYVIGSEKTCGGNGDRIHRHDSLRDTLYLGAQCTALVPRREVPSLIPGSRSCPADIYLPIWERGQPAALDVMVISTLQQQTIAGASTTQGHALSVGEKWKMAAQAEACHFVGVSFNPLVVESIGCWSDRAGSRDHTEIWTIAGPEAGIPPPIPTARGWASLPPYPPLPKARHPPLEGKCHNVDPPHTHQTSRG